MSATVEFNPFDPATMQCPFPHYAQMRAGAPVAFVPQMGMWFVTRHDLVLQVLRDTATFSSRFGGPSIASAAGPADQRLKDVVAEGYPRVSTMLTEDPPEHTRFRGLVSKAFTPKAVAALEPFVRRIVTDLLDAWGDRTEIEFVQDFAVPLPVKAIATMLGVPEDRYPDVKRWSDAFIAGIGTQLDLEGRIAAERQVNEFQHYFAAEVDRRRAEPQADLLSDLLAARIDEPGVDARPLDTAEILSILSQLMTAGNETTTKLLAEAMLLLWQHPGEWAALRADPDRADAVVEEALRLSTPTQGMFRKVTTDTELGGQQIPKGSMVVAVYAAANRDTEVFGPDAEAFCPGRAKAAQHLAFGKGIHFCLGAPLSRLEARVALEEIARRVEGFDVVGADELRYFPSFILRGLERLPLQLTGPTAPSPAEVT